MIAQERGIECHTCAYVDGRKFFQQFLISICRRIALHQSVCRIKKFCRRHGKRLVYRNKVIFLCIRSPRRSICLLLTISRERKKLHLFLNGINIGEILFAGQHNTGDQPHRCGRHIHARHPVRQFTFPIGTCNRVCTRLVQHGSGVRPGIQNLQIAKTIRFRQNVNHGLSANVEPCL